MAETAATAIGIISFGLAVCKGLYTYYHAYTGFDSNISSAHESIAQVARTLILLKDSCNDPDLGHERKDRVATCVCSCEDAAEQLNDLLIQVCSRQDDSTLAAIGLLLDHSADPNAEGGGALLAALEYGREAPVALLEARGAENLASGQLNDALVRVCQNQDDATLTAVEMLLDRGADANAHDGGVLLAALKFGEEPVVVLLEARGAREPTFEQLNDALVHVSEWPSFNSDEAMKLLIDRGADAAVNLANDECLT